MAGQPRPMVRGSVTSICITIGLLAATGLSIMSVITTIMGVDQVMTGYGGSKENLITFLTPYLIAGLVLCFNATSSHMFRRYQEIGLASFGAGLTTFFWVLSITWDGLSSYIGILSSYTGISIDSMEKAQMAMDQLGPLATLFAIIMAAMFSSGPFFASLFSDMLKDRS